MASESPVTEFLSLLTKEWVAYSSEGESLRASVQDIARIHGAKAEIAMLADGAVLTVFENNRVETITVVASQEITRLDRFTDIKHVMEQASAPDVDLDVLSAEIAAIADSPPIYAEWMKALGIVLFSVGFSVTVQGTWQEVGFAALTAVAVAFIVVVGDRIQRVSVLIPLLAAVVVSLLVLLLVDPAEVDGGAILLMVPALFFFIPGDILSASMLELAMGRITSGSALFVYSIFTLLLLYLGVVFGAVLTGASGAELFGEAVDSEFPVIVPWLGWALFAFGFMMAFSVRMRYYGWVLLGTLVAFGATQLGTALAGEVVGTYLGAAATIVVAAAVARGPDRPPLMVVALSGFFVLTVGALGLEGFTALISGDAVAGFTDLLKMLTIGMAIALGLLTGAVLVRRAAE